MSNPYDTAKARKASVLGPTLKFKGELSADEDLLIQGAVEGSIRHSSSLTIGDSGRIKADIEAEYVAVEGNVEGDIHGSQSVTVRETKRARYALFATQKTAPTAKASTTSTTKMTSESRMRRKVKSTPPGQRRVFWLLVAVTFASLAQKGSPSVRLSSQLRLNSPRALPSFSA